MAISSELYDTVHYISEESLKQGYNSLALPCRSSVKVRESPRCTWTDKITRTQTQTLTKSHTHTHKKGKGADRENPILTSDKMASFKKGAIAAVSTVRTSGPVLANCGIGPGRGLGCNGYCYSLTHHYSKPHQPCLPACCYFVPPTHAPVLHSCTLFLVPCQLTCLGRSRGICRLMQEGSGFPIGVAVVQVSACCQNVLS